MKNILSLIVAFSHSIIFAQASSLSWQKPLGGSGSDESYTIGSTSDGGVVVAGLTLSNNGDVSVNYGSFDMWVVKLQANGTIEWQKSLGGSSDDVANSIQQTNDGGYIVAGYTFSNNGDVSGNHGSSDCWIVKLNANGSLAWQKTFGGTGNDYAKSITQTNDNGFVIAAYSASNDGNVTGNHGNTDYWILKLDAAGTLQWQKSLGGTAQDVATGIQQTDDGYVVAGWSNSNNGDITGAHGDMDYWIVKLDLNGNLVWQKSLGGSSNDQVFSITKNNEEEYIVAGLSASNDGDVTENHDSDFWIVKLSASGNIIWQKTLGGSGVDRASDIIPVNGGYVVAGWTEASNGDVSENQGGWDYWITKIDFSGNLIWQKTLGGSGNDQAYSIQPSLDGGYFVSGVTFSNDGDVIGNHGQADYWVVKLDTDPSLAISEHQNIIDIKIYPNPTIDFLQISSKERIEAVTLFDLSGKKIADNTENEISLAAFPKGIYTVKITSENGKIETRKIIKK